jgi:type VI protein secretion system component VasK
MQAAETQLASEQKRIQAQKRGVLLATVGYLLTLVIVLFIKLVDVAHFSMTRWLTALGYTLAVQAILCLVPHWGWTRTLTSRRPQQPSCLPATSTWLPRTDTLS